MVEHSSMDPFQMIEETTHSDFSRGRITPTSFDFNLNEIAMGIDKNDLSSADEEEESSSTSSSIAIDPLVAEDEGCEEVEKGRTIERIITIESTNTEDAMGFKRFACKARNVGESHTSKTAYIELPPDAAHGLQLFCSNHECAGSGRAFRWCNVCEVIVAKRNFVKRHSHGLLSAARTKSRSSINKGKKKKAVIEKLHTKISPWTTEALATEGDIGLPAEQGPAIQLQKGIVEEVPERSSSSSLLDAGAGSSMPLSTLPSSPSRSSTDLSTRDQTRFRVFAQEEDASIQAIGNLKGWNEADIDSIFD